MRILHELHSNPLSPAFTYRDEPGSLSMPATIALGTPGARRTTTGELRGSSVRTRNSLPQPTARRVFLRAMSWLIGQLIEGMAAYGHAMHPGFDGLEQHITDWKRPENLEFIWQPRYRHGEPVRTRDGDSCRERAAASNCTAPQPQMAAPVEPTDVAQTSSIRPAASNASPVTRFWSRVRRERQTRLSIANLEALDDRTLRDIGISRCQIENSVRHERPFEL